MLELYIKAAWRNILHQKGYTLINLLGLVIGIVAFLQIMQYVLFEKNYDGLGKNSDQIYRVNLLFNKNGSFDHKTALSFPESGPELVRQVPQIKDYCRLYSMQSSFTRAISFKDDQGILKVFNEDHLYYTEPGFFNLFPFEIIGSGASLDQPYTAIISEEISVKYFGDINPIGKKITFQHSNGKHEYTITGIVKIPENTHLAINILFSYVSLQLSPLNNHVDNNWDNEVTYTYVQLDNNCDPNELKTPIAQLIKDHTGESRDIQFELQGITEIHTGPTLLDELKPTTGLRNLNFLFVGGWLLLVISLINYFNLLLGSTIMRKKEIFVRLVTGATKWQLFETFAFQFLLTSLIALLLAGIIVFVIQDYRIRLPVTTLLLPISSLVLMLIFSGGLAAYILTTQNQKWRVLKPNPLKRVSIGLQFLISTIIIISIFTVYRQIDFVKSKDMGFNANDLLVIRGPTFTDFSDSIAGIHNESFKNELLKNPHIANVAYSAIIPGMENSWITEAKTDPKAEKSLDIGFNIVSENFLDTYQIKLLTGRVFNHSDIRKGQFGERVESVIINIKAVDRLGFESYENVIGKTLVISGKKCQIIGVVGDFHQETLHHPVRPSAYFLDKNVSRYFTARLNQDTDSEVISIIKESFTLFFPSHPFESFLLQVFLNSQYQKEKQFFNWFSYLSIVTILISCIGLFSISLEYSAQKVKEIGIRKVNGAKVVEILTLLNKDFVKWVVIAFFIATPIAWYTMDQWLQNFAYKTELSWWVFALAGLLALGIALLTVSWQSWKAATRNPVEALRYE